MSSQGPKYTLTGTNDASVGGTAWINPDYIDAPSDYADAFLTGYTTSNYLKGTNCGFTIPSGATIDGIEVTFRVLCATGTADFSYVRLVVGGTITGNNLASGSVPESFTSVVFGGPTELWGLSPTETQINLSNFGAVLAVSAGASGATVYCDYMEIKVYYTGGTTGSHDGDLSYWADTFLTFRSVSIPVAATINKAFVRFTAKSGLGSSQTVTNDEDIVEVMIFGNNEDDSSPPTDLTTYKAKTLTDNRKNWSSIAHWTDETTYDTPDISCIIQEIVDRSGWTPGNDISVYVQNNYSTEMSLHDLGRRAYDYGTSSAKAAQLFVYYTLDEHPDGVGVVCGGAADNSRAFIYTISAAGAMASGAVTNASTYNISVITAGLYCGGNSSTQYNANVSSTGNGALAGSSAIAYAIQSFIVIPNGVMPNGSATVDKILVLPTDNTGILTAGDASVLYKANTSGNSGAILSGSALESHYPSQLESAGALASGIAVVTSVSNQIVMANGAITNGNSTQFKLAIHSVDPSGAILAGSGSEKTKYTIATSSGITTAGNSTISVDYNIVALQGVMISGVSLNTEIFNSIVITPNGSMLNGSAIVQGKYAIGIIADGVLTNGSSTLNQVFQPTSQGGICSSGTSAITSFVNEPVSGVGINGVVPSGASVVTQPVRHFFTTGNTVVLDSLTTFKPIGFYINYPANGQVSASGSAIAYYGFKYDSTGGIALNSDNITKASYVTTVRGFSLQFGSGTLVKRGAYEFEASNSTSFNLSSQTIANFRIICTQQKLPCSISSEGAGADCPSFDYYYSESKVYIPTDARGKGAYLPAITKCRQQISSKRRSKIRTF